MGLIAEIDRMDDDQRRGILRLYRKSEPQLYEEFAEDYCKQGHTWTEACQLICEDMRRRDPKLYDEEYLAGVMEFAAIGEARMKAQRSSQAEEPSRPESNGIAASKIVNVQK